MNQRLKPEGNKGYIISIALALILVSSLLIGYYLVTHLSEPEGYTTINLLDFSQKKAINYPELVVINLNNTFNVWVDVENHKGVTLRCVVQQKITNETITTTPVNISPSENYTEVLEKDQSREILATVSVNEPGSYSVVFELWVSNVGVGEAEFTHNYCVLNIEAVGNL